MNLGPLLYHFADQPGEHSIEPSYEEVKNILTGVGFKITVSFFVVCDYVCFLQMVFLKSLRFSFFMLSKVTSSSCANYVGF